MDNSYPPANVTPWTVHAVSRLQHERQEASLQIAGSTIDGAFIDGRDWGDYGAFGINQAGEVAGYKAGTNPYRPRSLPYNPAIFDGNKWEVFDIARLYPRGTRPGVYADRFILNSINDGGYAVGYKYVTNWPVQPPF